MDTQNSGDVRRDLEQQIIERAWRDDSFRQELLRDTKAVVAREYGIYLPENMNLVVHEETPTTLHFVLPRNPAGAGDDELSDAELEMVAGGKDDGPRSCTGPRTVGIR